MINRKKLTPKEKKEADYILVHKRNGEEFGTCSKKLFDTLKDSPSWEIIKQPKKAGRPKKTEE